MSWKLTRLVLERSDLNPTEKAVAHCLAFHAPEKGDAYPSMDTIALESGLSCRQAAQRVVRRLEAKGVITPTSTKRGGKRKTTHYRFANSNPPVAVSASKQQPV